ncbi:MAG: T9SS type A sorting domain-containing protein [Flavobacteriales bacterium]|nr:T9SS type A sorting domain-containing protein [Flavobacteriales bacterium]
MKRTLLSSLATILLASFGIAQETHWCETDRRMAEEMAKDPAFAQKMAQFRSEMRQLMANNASLKNRDVVYTVPVVFHIIHLNSVENISNEQIEDAMFVLNRDWAKQNPDTAQVHPSMQDRIGDMGVQFKLATKDPSGNCTNGIIRYQSTETLRGEGTSKLRPWPREKYMNVYVVRGILSGAAGYFTPGGWSVLDGIMIIHQYVGRSGNAGGIPFTGNEGLSRALTHEVGHYLDLAHVWGENNGIPGPTGVPWAMQADCGDDGVEDTPITRGWSPASGCNGPGHSDNTTRPWGNCDQQSFKSYHGRSIPFIVPSTPTRYDFEGVTTGSGSVDNLSVIPIIADSLDSATVRIPLSPFSATGVSANSSVAGAFAFSNWDTGANDGETDYANLTGSINTGKYYEFTINTPVQQQLYFYGLTFKAMRSDNGPRTFAVRSSANNYSTNIAMGTATGISAEGGNVGFFTDDAAYDGTVITVNPANTGFGLRESGITLRIYAYNAEDPSGYFGIDSLVVRGKSGTIENVQNYMEYSYCSIMFTEGQRERARTALLSPVLERDNLWTEQNLIATGVAEGHEQLCAPIADFYAQVEYSTSPGSSTPPVPFPPMTCINTNVRFIDNTQRASVTSWNWTFQDGNPATSTARNPVVQFTARGWKTVTLTVSNDQGSDTKTKDFSIYAGNSSEELTAFAINFEDGDGENLFPLVGYNYENNHTSWKRFEGGGYSGNACARLNSGDRDPLELIRPDNIGDYDDLVSPHINMTGAPISQLSFRYAYRTNTNVPANITEKLVVEQSSNCGRTWSLLGTTSTGEITGTNLVTNGNFDEMPPPPDSWRLKTLNLLSSQLGPNMRFRFRYISSGYSGDLFIDDIQFGSSAVSVQEWLSENFIAVFPNPANDQFTLQIYGMGTDATEVTITDLRGAVVYQNTYQPTGNDNIELAGRTIGLTDGMYLVRAQNAHGQSVQKLVMGR